MSIGTIKLDADTLNTLNYNDKTHFIAIQKSTTGKSRIIQVKRSDVTCWQLFLKFFNLGKLANTSLSLYEVTTYLSRFNWSEFAYSPLKSESKAYKKICLLANKGFASGKGNLELCARVANETITMQVIRCYDPNTHEINIYSLGEVELDINPFMQISHLKRFLPLGMEVRQQRDGGLHEIENEELLHKKRNLVLINCYPNSLYVPSDDCVRPISNYGHIARTGTYF